MAADLDGTKLGLTWCLPFVGILLSIALFPLFAPHFWEHHHGKVALFWAVLISVPMALSLGTATTANALVHTALLEYIPFILLLLALFTVASGIVVSGNLHGAPMTNTVLLGIGTILASLIGTTGASMVMIRPVLRANDDRKHNVHVVVFFIFLVSNIGGSLTPLGDPPLFLGFLRGVDFFWTTRHLFSETLFVSAVLLAAFFVMDTIIYRREGHVPSDPTPDQPIRLHGGLNMLLGGVIIIAILLSAKLQLGTLSILGTEVSIQNLLRDAAMVVVTLVSILITPKRNHEANGFSWSPIAEVAALFAGIFVSIVPVLAMLRAGSAGAFAPLVAMVTNADGSANVAAYFWLTGALSSFLDNAPTYLVFFELAGGNAEWLMRQGALTLAAISSGAVFMGANTYIGNAPNFMVYAIARQKGVKMPSFFGYMLWSGCVLLPVFALTTLIFFRT
ncbi:sodium:proton antiporter [Bradyrhizobium roseum]|uniref:sodium:proton antiporter n=1 Tax=Bradyrhizobium roseum TaxID=3056648 RepID=UPI00261DCDD4|nr:sodium:proton antiporter [Bradyrhizobium roseus]WKA32030.1 sodium:proton antiporter [Bradyrhizobium roseus]